MIASEGTLLVLLLIIGVGLLIPEFFKKRIPLIVIILLLGSILGPNGLDYIIPDQTIEFFGFLGMTFLMLMAGMETDTSLLKTSKRKIITLAAINGLIPFVFGMGITYYFGYPFVTSLLLGVVFISSSVAIIIPSLKGKGIFKKEFGQIILAAVLLADIVSLVALSFVLQTSNKIANIPLPYYYLFLFVLIFMLFKLLPKLSSYALHKRFSKDEGMERKLRFVLLIIISAIFLFSVLGVHPILAAFLVGLALSGIVMEGDEHGLYNKVHTLGYGLFIPIFFFIVGMDLNLNLLKSFDPSNVIMISLILGLLISKIGSGYFAGKLVGFKEKEAWTFGFVSIPQLTTTLAVTYTAASLGLLDTVLTSTIILIAIITTFLGPTVVGMINRR